MPGPADDAEAARLEGIWSGEFGDAWSDRNLHAYDGRAAFWDSMMARLTPSRVLEVGCNVGGNLRHIAPHLPSGAVYGIDVNRHSLALLRGFLPDVNALVGSARELPFRDDWFDLTFTVGVLIHQPTETLPEVLRELARCSARHVFFAEIFAETETEIVHRGVERGLFKRDYGAIAERSVPELTLRDSGFAARDSGFDDLHWWLFEKGT